MFSGDVMRILLTGASGFIGKHLIGHLGNSDLTILTRQRDGIEMSSVSKIIYGNVFNIRQIDYKPIDVDTVVHLAWPNDDSGNYVCQQKLAASESIRLMKWAADAGVKRFIFLSTIKVNGELTSPSHPFGGHSAPNPSDEYGFYKHVAERGLFEISAKTGMEGIVVRAPLVYGQGVKGNFWLLTKLVASGVPMPFGSVKNRRSFISVYNLIDLLIACAQHPNAANKILLSSDDQDVSTPEFIDKIAHALGKSSRQFPFPQKVLKTCAGIVGKQPFANRLLGSLQVDISETKKLLGWKPPFTLEEGLNKCFDNC
jgi:nucleoside-diphosphate-sugar epimerase